MSLQNLDQWRKTVDEQFAQLKAEHPEKLERRIDMSWSNWGFGLESLAVTAERLAKAGLEYIELHGNHYGPDLGYKVDEARRILADNGLKLSGVCGMFSTESEFSSTSHATRQRAIDYTRREVEFCAELGGEYLLLVPGAVGRPDAYDNSEWYRSTQALGIVADALTDAGIKGAIEPIRAAEVSLVHTVAEAVAYIDDVGHPGVQHINGDVYHMQVEEVNIPLAIIEAGDRLTNLHLADSNRRGLGWGSLDVDTLIKALYVIGYNTPGHYVTPEPLGPGAGPYPAMHSLQDPAMLDELVFGTVTYWRQREEAVLDNA
ncbi:MAG: sugar phosphate isomerase/epimerase [Propionibacteriaceae bacterium]|jgi:sugar phosphate isomerase/epimerase|nr:sugar phosphate isomerase/epimerase [Propionibacteriaceae bacterium]